LAANTIVDIVRISELNQLQVPTTKDELVINNFLVNQDDYESKRISITDLADYIGGTIRLRDLVDVCNTPPRVGQYLKWNGTCWNPEFQNLPLIKFSDFSVTNYPTPYKGGRLGYDGRGGFTFEPADVYGPLSNHNNVSGGTAVDKAVLTFDAPSGYWYPEEPYEPIVIQQSPSSWPANKGELRIQGDRTFVYTPPYLEDFLTEYIEYDPVFTASPAGSITLDQINDWDTTHGWGDHAVQGYLKSMSIGQLTDVTLNNPKDSEILIYDRSTNRWRNGPVNVNVGSGLINTASAINVGEGIGLKVTNDKVALVDNFRGSNGVPRKNSGLNINNNELTVAIDDRTIRINDNNQLYSTISADFNLVNKIVAGKNVTISESDGTGILTINAADASVKRLIAGNNITLSPSDGTGNVTISTTNDYWVRNPSTSSLIPKDPGDNLLINSTITAKNFNIPYLPELKDVRDSDFFMVHRNGASYKMSFATLKSLLTDSDPEEQP
jgi:hypothetical protein